MTMHVLLATDGSPDAEGAVGWLTGFPLPDDSHVRVVTCSPNVFSIRVMKTAPRGLGR